MTKIIAEIGWNHMGDINLARHMIQEAKNSGADFAKFQTWRVKNLKDGPWDKDGRRDIYQKAELTNEKHHQLIDICNEIGIPFLTSVFNPNDVEFVSTLIDQIKIPSSEMRNTKLIENIITFFKPKENHHIFMSTGSSTWEEIESATKLLKTNNMNFSILHCVSAYPCPPEICNLDKIKELKKLHHSVGYSGHCVGINDAIVSLEYNVDLIEKHFTTDQTLPGRDNQFAILPKELKFLCNLRNERNKLQKFLGKEYLENEKDNRNNYSTRWGD